MQSANSSRPALPDAREPLGRRRRSCCGRRRRRASRRGDRSRSATACASSSPQPRVIMRASRVDAPACAASSMRWPPRHTARIATTGTDGSRRTSRHHAVRQHDALLDRRRRVPASAQRLAHARLGLPARTCVAAALRFSRGGRIAATVAFSGRRYRCITLATSCRRTARMRSRWTCAELRIAGDRRMPAERARPALRGLELAHEAGLGGDPRLVELVRARARRRARAPVIDERADRSSARIAACAVARQHEESRIAQRVDVRVGAGHQLLAVAQLARQPRVVALAEQDRRDVERRDIGVTRRGHVEADAEVRLADVAMRGDRARCGLRRLGGTRRAGRPAGIARNRRSTPRRTRAGSTSPATTSVRLSAT